MAKLRLTTFNVENLFNRYSFLDKPWMDRDYEKYAEVIDVVSIASRRGDLVSYPITQIQRNNTAMALLDANPDDHAHVVVVEEIENIYTLRNFNEIYLNNYFERIISLDGNDPRGIDVGLMIKRSSKDVVIENIRTHIDDLEKKGGHVTRRSIPDFGYSVLGAIFSRDCLEVDLRVGAAKLTLLVNHFKAQDKTPKKSDAKRTRQAERVAELVDEAEKLGRAAVVMGDLNVPPKNKTISAVRGHAKLQDPYQAFDGIHANQKNAAWTHYYTADNSVSRLDYILVSKKLSLDAPDPEKDIVRKGQTTKNTRYKGPRYGSIGPMHTEASDHCPVSVTLNL